MRLVTLQQCGKCPPASPVAPRREERPGRWERAFASFVPLGTLLVFCSAGPLHPWRPIRLTRAPHFWDAFARVGSMLDPRASLSSSLSVTKSSTKIHLQILNSTTRIWSREVPGSARVPLDF